MAHYTLIARINTGDGKFPFVNCSSRRTIARFRLKERPTTSVRAAAATARQSRSAKMSPLLTLPRSEWRTANPPNALLRCTVDRRPVLPLPPLARESPKPRGSTLSVASRNRGGPTWAIASPSICSSQAVEDLFRPDLPRRHARLSARFADSSIERDRQANGESPCSTTSSRQWFLSTTVALGSTWGRKIGCRKRTGPSTWTNGTRTKVCNLHGARSRGHDSGRG